MSTASIEPGFHRDRPLLGVAYTLMSVLLFSLMDATVKWLSADYPIHEIVFFRCVVALAPALVFIHQAGGFKILRTFHPVLHALRAAGGLGAMFLSFQAYSLMPLADAVSVFYAAPLFMAALSVPMLGEHVGVRRWTAIAVGFAGVLIVVRPGGDVFGNGGLLMLSAAALVGVTTNLIRRLSATDDAASTSFYFTASGALFGTIACLWAGWIVPGPFDLLLFLAVGLLGGCAQYTLTLSYRYAEVGFLAPLKYLAIISGGIIGYLVWSEVPDAQSLTGIAIIIGSGLYMVHRETWVRRQR